MAKVKFTKTELKAQRDALGRFQRYLPTLQLKRQQLQAELRRLRAEADALRREREELTRAVDPWIALFGETPERVDLADHLVLETVRVGDGNLVGVTVPVFEEVVFARPERDPFATDPWIDPAIEALEQLVQRLLEGRVLAEQIRRLDDELRTTTQRVNLFEKVKIPACRENIRAIRIALGDEQTAAVARSKIAKRKHAEDVSAP